MSDFAISAQFVLANEDSTLSGKVVPDPTKSDPKAVSRFGVNSHTHPELISVGFFDTARMSRELALQYAEDTFKFRYFCAIRGYAIIHQDIANKWADLAFNEGPEQSTKIVQRALNVVLPNMLPAMDIDGKVGDKTIGRVNAAEPERLLPAIKEKAKDFYVSLAAAHPEMQPNLAGWLKRVDV